MKNAWTGWGLLPALLATGCSGSSSPPPATAGAPPAARKIARTEGVFYVGFPESPALAVCDRTGRWGPRQAMTEHWLVDADARKTYLPEEGEPRVSLFRSTLPFPQLTWKAGDFVVTQLVYPAGSGFVARYHVMNHGNDFKTCRLFIGRRDAGAPSELLPAGAPAEQTSSHVAFELRLEPGISQFPQVTTTDLAGRIPAGALDRASETWEKLLSGRSLNLPDPAAMTAYYADLAGKSLGVPGSEEALRTVEQKIARREGNALRLLPDVPERWQNDSIEVHGIPTDFGPLTFRYQGAYNSRSFELQNTCKPPDGFVIAVPPRLKARIDDKPVPVADGVLRFPAGTRVVEASHRE